jgi:hypothetical protein
LLTVAASGPEPRFVERSAFDTMLKKPLSESDNFVPALLQTLFFFSLSKYDSGNQ